MIAYPNRGSRTAQLTGSPRHLQWQYAAINARTYNAEFTGRMRYVLDLNLDRGQTTRTTYWSHYTGNMATRGNCSLKTFDDQAQSSALDTTI